MIKMRSTIYSKCQTVKQYKTALLAAPKQQPNTEESFEGKVFELYQNVGGPVGTLSEIYDAWKENEVMIEAKDGCLLVGRDEEGNWQVRNL